MENKIFKHCGKIRLKSNVPVVNKIRCLITQNQIMCNRLPGAMGRISIGKKS